MSTLTIGLVGLGDIAQKAWLPLAAADARIKPLLCSRQPEVLARLCQQYRAPGYACFSELLAARPDALMVHAATSAHFDLVSQALRAGIPVLVDKPVAAEIDQVEALFELAAANNTWLLPAFNRRFAPLVQRIAQEEVQAHRIVLEKNRQHLPGELRTFVFDDFIHLLDTLVFMSQGKLNAAPRWLAHWQGQQLLGLYLDASTPKQLLLAHMNRDHSQAEEIYRWQGAGLGWQIDNLRQGQRCQAGQCQQIGFDDWQPTLYKRGFVGLLDHFIAGVCRGHKTVDESYLLSHRLAHYLVEHLEHEKPD